MATQTAALVPVPDLRKRYKIRPKVWRGLTKAKLLPPAQRIPGSKSYGFSADAAERVKAISRAKMRIPGRATMSALAFQLALDGDRSAIALVKNDSKKRVRRYYGRVKRSFQRGLGLSPNLRKNSENDIRSAARKISKLLSKNALTSNRQRISDALYILAFMLMSMMYLNKSVLGNSRSIKELLLPLMSINHPEKGWVGIGFAAAQQMATHIAFMTDGIKDCLSLDEKVNPYFRQLDRIPDENFWKLFEVWPDVCTAFWTAYDRLAKSMKLPIFKDTDSALLNDLLFAALISYYDSGTPEIYAELYKGKATKLASHLNDLVTAVEGVIVVQKLFAGIRNK
jgi:hypothetical protein